LQWLESVERGYLDQIAGDTADEVLEALVRRSKEKVPGLPAPVEAPSRFGRLFLRMLVLEHARRTAVAERDSRSSPRWKLLAASLRFMFASSRTPALRAELKRVPIAEIELSFGPLPPAAEEGLDRYFRAKVQSLQFCGKGFHDCSLIEGFRNLALMYPILVWLARWLALSDGRPAVSASDVQQAISIADYQYSFAPYLPWRTRLLQQRNDVVRLCAWYAADRPPAPGSIH
jgi:lysine-N-methylase